MKIIKSSIRTTILFLILGGPALESYAQEEKLGNWIGATSSMRLSDHWSIFLQGEWRSWEMFNNTNELLWRVAGKYDFSSKLQGAFGYVRVDTWPYDPEVNSKFDENRFYQELLVKGKWGRTKIDHRFRLEQRWITTVEYGKEFSNRVRYKLGFTIPIGNSSSEVGSYFIKGLNEIFLDLDPDHYYYEYDERRVGLNQNRLLLTFGKQVTALSNIRTGLLWQHRPNGDFFRWIIYYAHNFDFRQEK